ncbi:alpha/beta hydrolase [Dyella jejuensis]|uniref:Alpha/beta hydrolase n=1 Tax=Dyella jejuensis TaxID=1432009 RepID=A0ABW8JFD3_9GAMM
MKMCEVGKESDGQSVKLYFEDVGHGRPVVLIHGWPVSQAMWEHQIFALASAGCRVISYDRRGFGRSSKPWTGYHYDTFADDLKALLDHLDLQDVTLVGFSMGGGEVARYMARHHGNRVSQVAFVSAVTPCLLKSKENPEGVDKDVFDDMKANICKDRPAFLQDFGKKFFGVSAIHHPVSQATLEWQQFLALPASLKATLDCVDAFGMTDFRKDLSSIQVPTLVIHGTDDKIVPSEASGRLTAKMVQGAAFREYDGAPHGLFITHKDQLNADLISFVR